MKTIFQIVQKTIEPIVFIILLAMPHNSMGGIAGEEVRLSLQAGTTKIDYRKNVIGWENIPVLVANKTWPGVPQVTDICARGTWLMYEKPNLLNKDMTTLDGIKVYTSDELTCFQKRELKMDDLGSVQHVTSYLKRRTSTITFFEYENFIGRAMVVNKERKRADDNPGVYTYIKSLITVGKQEWEVMLQEGPTRLCFTPPQDMDLPVCLISQLIDGTILIDSGVLQVNHAREPCSSNRSLIVELKECYENTAGIIHPKPSNPFTSSNETVTEENKCEESNEILDDELIGLIAGRLNGSLGSGEWFSAITDTRQIWKAELFDKCFQVLSTICPESVIDKEYLLIFASLFFYHMNKVWDARKFLDVPISEVAWMEILYDMNACVFEVTGGDYDTIATDTAAEMETYTSLDEITVKFEDMLGYRPDYDHVMEINWLMANLVAGVCTRAKRYDTNFLPRFLNIFHILYFSPIEEQWMTPGKFETVYKYLFGGYGMRKSLTKIALCTYNAMKFSGITEPYKRPMEQTDKILLPKAEVDATTK